MPAYIFSKDTKVNSVCGIHCASFEANVPMEVSPVILTEVLAAGGVLASAVASGQAVMPTQPVVANSEASIADIVSAMTLLIEQNDATTLTTGGMPRANAIESLLGRATTKDERAAAWSQIEA